MAGRDHATPRSIGLGAKTLEVAALHPLRDCSVGDVRHRPNQPRQWVARCIALRTRPSSAGPAANLRLASRCDPDAARRYDLGLLLRGHVCRMTTFGAPLAVGDPRTSLAASGIRGVLPRPPSNRRRVPGPVPPSRCRSGAGYSTTPIVATGDQLAALVMARTTRVDPTPSRGSIREKKPLIASPPPATPGEAATHRDVVARRPRARPPAPFRLIVENLRLWLGWTQDGTREGSWGRRRIVVLRTRGAAMTWISYSSVTAVVGSEPP